MQTVGEHIGVHMVITGNHTKVVEGKNVSFTIVEKISLKNCNELLCFLRSLNVF